MQSDLTFSSLDDTLDSTDKSSFFTPDRDELNVTKRHSGPSKDPPSRSGNDAAANHHDDDTRKRKMVSLDTGELASDDSDDERNQTPPGSSLVELEGTVNHSSTISDSINSIHSKFSTPTQILQLCAENRSTKIMVGQFIPGYVLDSSGSTNQKIYEPQRSRSSGRQARTNKRNNISGTGCHTLLLADEQTVLKFWSSYNSSSSAEQIKSVRRLAANVEKSFTCIAIESGPLEVRTTLEKYRKYVEATKEKKSQLLKTKVLILPGEQTIILTFTMTESVAVPVDTWMEVDTLVESQDSFKINVCFAVVSVGARHDAFISSNGVKYLRGSLQDRTSCL